jgi:DNA-binding NarL/FixJ family response regulator
MNTQNVDLLIKLHMSKANGPERSDEKLAWGFRKKIKPPHTLETKNTIPLPGDGTAVAEREKLQESTAAKPERTRFYSDTLTERERDVFELLIQGKTMKDIAIRLGVKYSTVNTHQKSVYKKLGLHSKTECILLYGLFNDGKEE